jgi:hypothetical protein
MDIQTDSMNMSQAMLQEEAAVLVQAKAMDAVREQAAAVEELISSAQVIVDPSLGQTVSVTA